METDVDRVARAQLSETRNQLHSMNTALLLIIDGIDRALKTLEGDPNETDPPPPDQVRTQLRDARGQVLNARTRLMTIPRG